MGLWDSPKGPGLSLDFGTVLEAQESFGTLGQSISRDCSKVLFLNLRDPQAWENPGFGSVPEARESPGTVGTVQKTQSPNNMVVIFQSQKLKSQGESQDFGTVSEFRDVGTALRPRVPTQWGLFLNLRDPKAWTVSGLWDCPKSPGQPKF